MNAAQNASKNAANSMKQGASKTMNKVKDFMQSKGGIILIICIVLLSFILVIIYISFVLKASNLKGKRLTASPIKLDVGQSQVIIDASEIPKPAVGREYSYSFWFYLEQFDKTINPKMIMYRGTSPNDIASANPIVFLDKNSNKMHFVIKNQDSTLSAIAPTSNTANDGINYSANLDNIITQSYFTNKNATIADPRYHKNIMLSIDYVPLQRWVHIAVVIDNKIMTIFMDGEIYSVKTTDEFKLTKKPELDSRNNKIDYNLIIDKTEGSIYIGKFNANNAPNSYLSNLEFYNYAMSVSEVRKVYMGGPFARNLLNMLGVSSYGIRSPLYKIDEYQKQQ